MVIARLVTPGRTRRVLLIAATFLVVQTAAAVHELQHALHHHENPSCPMHVYADHFGKASTSTVTVALPAPPHDAPVARPPVVRSATPALGYYTRGPPCSS